mmetsp:Transcript_8078/g.13846  ORF Transcript_8078/g.13846 Transcript_8078/m.13846 type:complete len:202 (-) Transcript_8078:193-798(-)
MDCLGIPAALNSSLEDYNCGKKRRDATCSDLSNWTATFRTTCCTILPTTNKLISQKNDELTPILCWVNSTQFRRKHKKCRGRVLTSCPSPGAFVLCILLVGGCFWILLLLSLLLLLPFGIVIGLGRVIRCVVVMFIDRWIICWSLNTGRPCWRVVLQEMLEARGSNVNWQSLSYRNVSILNLLVAVAVFFIITIFGRKDNG